MKRLVEPESFWKEYSAKLNQKGTQEAYKDNTEWTEKVLCIAEKTCKKFNFKIETSREYYRVDLIGWRREKTNEKRNWWLDVAYEHENKYNTWDDELCKLCYVAADLRVISGYHDFNDSEEPIEKKLKGCLGRLGKEKILRVPNSKWLFVFGPRLTCTDQSFKAFTINEKMTIIPVSGGEEVVPQRWK